jgi:hypothetical protein
LEAKRRGALVLDRRRNCARLRTPSRAVAAAATDSSAATLRTQRAVLAPDVENVLDDARSGAPPRCDASLRWERWHRGEAQRLDDDRLLYETVEGGSSFEGRALVHLEDVGLE